MPVDRARPFARSHCLPAVTAVLLAAVTLSGCGGGDVVDAGDDGVISHPRGDEVVLQVRRVGGFQPLRVFADVPSVTVLGDGTMITEGPQIAIFPPPALPPLLQVRLSEEGLQEVLAAADEAGLLSAAPDYGTPPIADAPTTVVTVHAEEEMIDHEIYALFEALGAAPGLTERQRQLRQAVSSFVSALAAPEQGLVRPTDVSEPRPFEAPHFAVRARPASPGEAEPVEGVEPQVLDWPLPDVDLELAERCLVIEGEQAERLGEALAQANTLTRFRQDGVVHALAVRPLVPPEESCDAVTVD